MANTSPSYDAIAEPGGVLVQEFPPPPPHWSSYGNYIDNVIESQSSSSSPAVEALGLAMDKLRKNLVVPGNGETVKHFVDEPPGPYMGDLPSKNYASIMGGKVEPPSASRTAEGVEEGLSGGRECFLSLVPSSDASKGNMEVLTRLQKHLQDMHQSISDLRAVDAVRVVKVRMEKRKRRLEKEIEELTETADEIVDVRDKIVRGAKSKIAAV